MKIKKMSGIMLAIAISTPSAPQQSLEIVSTQVNTQGMEVRQQRASVNPNIGESENQLDNMQKNPLYDGCIGTGDNRSCPFK